MIGLSNVAALETAPDSVTCNVIVPAAVTRMAQGIDTSAYPPMGAELVAPVVGWLAHESCSVSGEMFIALAAGWRGRSSRKVQGCTGRPGRSRTSASISMRSETSRRR